MKFRWLTGLASLLAFCVAAWVVPLESLFAVFQPATVAISIMAAAVLVRLNRGMPTLDWKSLDPAGRKRLTTRIVDLHKDYLSLLMVEAILVAVLMMLVIVTLPVAICWHDWLRRFVSGVLCGGMVLIVARMGLIVWRDYDIVRLQKHLIDEAADNETTAMERQKADDTVSSMRQSLRDAPRSSIRGWDDNPPDI